MKMHLYEMFKMTSWGRHKEVFSGRFDDIPRRFLLKYKKK